MRSARVGWLALGLAFPTVACTGHDGPATPRATRGDGTTPAGDGGLDEADGQVRAGDDGGSASAGLPCDVQAFLASHCTSCHDGVSRNAPFALLTYDDLMAPAPGQNGASVAERALVRLRDPVRPMPPGELLPDAVTTPLSAWLEGGATPGSCRDTAPPPLPFEPVSPASALAKVKTLLTGEAVTADELARYAADEDALPALIDTFMASPRFEATLRTFFASAFQQTELLPTSLGDQLGEPKLQGQPQALARLLANLEESFARTALAIVQEGRPFTEVLTTTRFQLSTALLSFLLVIDARHLDDAGKLTTPAAQFDVRTEGEPIPFADSIDPGKPATYRHFTAIGATNGCASTTRTSKSEVDLFELLLGVTPRGPGCNVSLTEPQLSEADFADFRTVDIASLPANGKRTPFFALPTLRGLTSVALSVPRVGFFTTPAFFANWATNDANQHRVTTNQTLIVALGASFDGSDATPAATRDGLSAEHGDEGTACYACHKTLDPMRQFFRQSFTYADHDQRDPAARAEGASFAFDGVTARGQGVSALATALAAHPRFASAWAQRLCYYANSAPCADDDPELQRVAGLFADARFDFKALVRALFASPLVTGRKATATSARFGGNVSIARRNHLCAALSTRLGLPDLCGLGVGPLTARQKQGEVVASSLPYDGYSRGSAVPVTLSDTSLFFRGATENLCALAAAQVVDVDASSRFRHLERDAALADMVASVMNLPAGDPRAEPALGILREHYDAAVAGGSTPTLALRSTFVLACSAPTSVAIGI